MEIRMDIKVGDIVTWRKPSTKTFQPMGVTGCKVLELDHVSMDGQPAALIEAFGEKLPVLISELHFEE